MIVRAKLNRVTSCDIFYNNCNLGAKIDNICLMNEFSHSKNFRRVSLSLLYAVLVVGGVMFGFNSAYAQPPMPVCGASCKLKSSFGACDHCCTEKCHVPEGPTSGDQCDIWCRWKWNM
jgi:hypothetical protein